ncbi:cytochrome P450 [Nocardia speluncae]|uniref:cytochrome P450 n=1 Tax=Nocardia speluncae TaxID=419477 RepID=UPI001444542A|nr:cytochrome P450 [Nocardia speluncae]
MSIRVPGRYDFIFLNSAKAYSTVLSLPAEHGSAGPILGLVPTVGLWFPRRSHDHDTLESLVLAGKKILAGLLTPDRAAQVTAMIGPVLDTHQQEWPVVADLSERLVPAVYEIAGRFFAGDAFWDRFGEELVPLLRTIADGIDVPRATVATTPLHRMLPEYRANGELVRVIDRCIREMPDSPLVETIREAGTDERDVRWMLMYILWNAVTYPGSYTLWTLVDILSDPRVHHSVHNSPDRGEYLGWCLWETIRLNPVSTLARWLKKPLTYTASDGTHYYLAADNVVGVFPAMLNKDPDRWPEPELYRPERFGDSPSPRTSLFGTGPFGCIAGEFSRLLISGVCDHLLTQNSLELVGPVPERRCRVHLTYPSGPVFVRVTAAQNDHIVGTGPACHR